MPLCVRCGAPNSDQALRCNQCGSLIPKGFEAADETGGLFTVEEGRSYPQPRERFETENLVQLRMALEDFLEGADSNEARMWLKHIRKHFEEFSRHGVTQLNRALDVERKLNSEGDFHHDVGYLVRKGITLCEEGLERLEVALEQEVEADVMPSFERFREGNDHICTALLLIQERQEMLNEAVARFAPEEE